MNRAVLDTNVIVSAVLVPAGTQAVVMLLALRGQVALYVSNPVLAKYEEVLRRRRLKLTLHRIEEALTAIRRIAKPVATSETLSISPHESDNRFLECAEAARADYLVTGNTNIFRNATRPRPSSPVASSWTFMAGSHKKRINGTKRLTTPPQNPLHANLSKDRHEFVTERREIFPPL